jgi:hypothetical protein
MRPIRTHLAAPRPYRTHRLTVDELPRWHRSSLTGPPGPHSAQGVRYVTNGLKVYYCPQMSFYNQACAHARSSGHFAPSRAPSGRALCVFLEWPRARAAHRALLPARPTGARAQASLPTLFTFYPLFREIAIREGVQIIHGHQARALSAAHWLADAPGRPRSTDDVGACPRVHPAR